MKEINIKVANLIKNKIPEISYNTWCKCIGDAYIQENNIIIPVLNEFEKTIIEDRYLELFNMAYEQFKDQLNYDKIILAINKDTDPKQEFEYKTAEQMKKLADEKNEQLIDIKKETKKTLKRILEAVEIMAGKGEYSTSYICCSMDECNLIENASKELEDLGFVTKISNFEENRKVLNIKWDSKEDENL